MPIAKPGRALLRNVGLNFVSQRIHGDGRKTINLELTLVPFIDLLIVLVVFLLISFDASNDLVAQSATFRIPDALNGDVIKQAPVVMIDRGSVTVEGLRVADTASLTAEPGLQPIEPLIAALQTIAHNWSVLHPRDELPSRIVVQADLSVDFRVLRKVTFSAARAGFFDVSFAVNRITKKGS